MADLPVNPYTPSAAALTHEDADAARSAEARKPSRLGALVLGFLAYPLMGAGFFALRRPRALAVWAAVGLSLLLLAIIGVRAPAPKLAVLALAGLYATLLWSLGHTAFARVGTGPPAARVWLLAIALIVAGKGTALAVRLWVMEAFKMPSGSMVPTLHVGDHLFVKKGAGGVARGDVIVFKFPADHSTDYLKRVLAVGGDTIEVRDGVPSINGVPLAHEPIDAPCSYRDDGGRGGGPDPEPEACTLVRETNAGRSYTIMLTPDHRAVDQPRTVIPEGELFVMGDNRDNSYDSRRWGTVNVELVKGTATVIWWSNDARSGIRWSRVGRGIQ
jgi:signal peptidase I